MFDPTRYIFTPLAVPRVEIDRRQLLDFYDRHKSLAEQSFLASLDYPWNAVHIRPDWLSPQEGEIPGSGWDEGFRSLFPQFVQQVESFPFQHIERVYILEQIKEVKPHQDISRENDARLGPSTFRCPVINDAPDRTFYLRKGRNREEMSITEIYPRLPSGAQWFGMNNYQSFHGSHMPRGEERKLMVCVWGQLKPEPWLDLLQKSVEIYRDYCIEAN